jgi:pimeloyl-ACP methyl ester carboxylesterase
MLGCASAENQAILDALPTSRTDMIQIAGLIRAPLPLTITLPDGASAQLEGVVVRPDRPGRFPLLFINHGTTSDLSSRRDEHAGLFTDQAVAFARRGWAVVSVVRPGFGRSGGPFLEDLGLCEGSRFDAVAKSMGDEILSIMAAVKDQHFAWADDTRILLLGHSGGGLASLAAGARQPAGVVGIINFAGGDGAPLDNTFCRSKDLIRTVGGLGRTSHVPSLWIYAHNDKKFPPHVANGMFDAFRAEGAPAELVLAPDYADTGHDYIEAVDLWWPRVEAFLNQQHLPATPLVAAAADGMSPPASMTRAEDQAFFDKYLKLSSYEKAFAVGDHGGAGYAQGYRTITAAKMIALQLCQRRDTGCRIYAVGNQPAQ